jgi:hypothetical protein
MTATRGDFERALDDFRKTAGLDEGEMADFEITDLQALQQTIINIQNKQAQNKKLMYMKRLEPFLKSMAEYGQVIEVFLNVSDIIAFVWVNIVTLRLLRNVLTSTRDQ